MIHFIHRDGSAGRRITIAYRFTSQNTVEYGASIFCPDPRRPETFRKASNRAHAVDRLTRFPITLTIDRDRTRVRNRGQDNETIVPVSVAYQIRQAVLQRGTHSHSRQFQVWQDENTSDLPDENIEALSAEGTAGGVIEGTQAHAEAVAAVRGETIPVAPKRPSAPGLIRRAIDRITG